MGDRTYNLSNQEDRRVSSTGGAGQRKRDKLLVFLDWLRSFLIVMLLGILITVFVVQRSIIQGPSMEPTLNDGDQIFIEKVSKHFSINRGDIVTIDHTDPSNPEILLIKRIIGLPGELVEIKEGAVYINGEKLQEDYLPQNLETLVDPSLDFEKLKLTEDQYFVLGDNRPVSKDSRRIGPVREEQIIGKLLFKFYPFNEIGIPK